MQQISLNEFLRLRKLVHRNARPLDYTKWRFLFENGSCDDFLLVLSSYQNEDGGFGHNLECNNWNPNSAPYTVCIALDYLDMTGDHGTEMKSKIIADIGVTKRLADFILKHADEDSEIYCTAVGNYYWGSNFIIRDLNILRKFGRLDFDLPRMR